MKKIYLLTLVFLFSIYGSVAAPLTINNNSGDDNPLFQGMYRVETYLGFMQDGDTCANDWIVPFIFDPGSSLYIADGSFVFSSPFNNFSACLSSYLGYSNCEAIALDWDGQRMLLEGLMDDNNDQIPNNAYPAGIIGLSTGGVECLSMSLTSSSIIYSSTPTSYSLLAWVPGSPNDFICQITYHRYGTVLATLLYE